MSTFSPKFRPDIYPPRLPSRADMRLRKIGMTSAADTI